MNKTKLISIKNKFSHGNSETRKIISTDRERTNILRIPEQQAIAFLVENIPSWLTSNMLTTIGFLGSIITFAGFVLAAFLHVNFLLIGVLGYAISWFGDSLDGRVAYYRHKPRKWFGFALDITVDWLGIILMGAGFMIYVGGMWELIGLGFVVMYGWEMITTLLRYKITGNYSIDSGILGPTEVRIIISLILVLEVFVQGSILYFSAAATFILFVVNIVDMRKLLKLADALDDAEKLEQKTKTQEMSEIKQVI